MANLFELAAFPRDFRIGLLGAICIVAGWASRAPGQLAPQEALTKLRPADDIRVGLFAAEPMITNPAAIDIDTHGRVWVAEIQFYRKNADPPADKIKVLEDTDGDGVADRVTVFAEGLFCPMSICVAGSKVYVATSPDLWVFEDADGDLKADGPPKRLLTGFGGYNHDHGAHSLVLGPDHKWWMAHGDGGFNVTGKDGSHIQYEWGAMLRGELDGTQLETVAVNFRNPYELCISSFGEVFCSDNDNDGNQSARICWIMPGGDYGWFKHPPDRVFASTPYGEHWHFRGHIPGFVPATLVTGFGSPSGICFYEGDAFQRFKNAPLHVDPGPREVRMYRHRPHGAGMQAEQETILTSDGDDYFRPVDICTAPDGSLYVADWYDGGVGGHAYNNPLQGRIYRLTPRDGRLATSHRPGPYDMLDDALSALSSPNLATQYLARESLLTAGEESAPRLIELLETADFNARARALWVLDRMGPTGRQHVAEQLTAPDERFRALAVRILGRRAECMPSLLALVDDPSWQVRRELLLAIGRHPTPQGIEALTTIALGAPANDRYLTEAIYIAAGEHKPALFQEILQRHSAVDRAELLLALDAERAIPALVKELLAGKQSLVDRRAVILQLGAQPLPSAASGVWSCATHGDVDRELRQLALEVTAHNLRGAWRDFATTDSFRRGVEQLLGESEHLLAALGLIEVAKLSDHLAHVADLAHDASKAVDIRITAIATAASFEQPESTRALLSLLDEPNGRIRSAALDGLIHLAAWEGLAAYVASGATPHSHSEPVLGRMMESAGGAIVLRRQIAQGALSASLQQLAVAQASQHPDANVRALYDDLLPADLRSQRLGTALSPDEILSLAGDAQRGEQVFLRSTAARCSKCHAIRGEGGSLGPDLSQIGRKYERAAMLETILEPSKAMAPEYVPYVVETKQGQLHLGFVVEHNDKRLILKDADGKVSEIAAEQVESIEAQTKSLIPELVLQEVSAQDAADLLAYLTSLR